ncbi:uncharacterized protein LOC116179122 [Photinus pyralis]|nr:uncharacterized protein LOC116179122 [Photinus pyralis]
MFLLVVLVVLLTGSTAANTNINTLYASLQKQMQVVKAIENREYLTAIIQLIELKFEVDPPDNFTRLQLYLLLTRRLLADVRLFINLMCQVVQRIRNTSNKLVVKFRTLLYVVRNVTHFIDVWTDLLLNVTEPLVQPKPHLNRTTDAPKPFETDIPNATVVLHTLGGLSTKVMGLESFEKRVIPKIGNPSEVSSITNAFSNITGGFLNIANNALEGFLQSVNSTSVEETSDQQLDSTTSEGAETGEATASEDTSETDNAPPVLGYPADRKEDVS